MNLATPNRQTVGQFTRVLSLAAVFVLFTVLPHSAKAYQLACRVVWQDQLLPNSSPEIAQDLQNAMATYQQTLGLSKMSHNTMAIDLLKIKIAQGSPEFLTYLKNLIATFYINAKALKYDPEANTKTFKRHLDAALTEISNPNKKIAENYKRTFNLEYALDQHFADIQAMTNSPVRMAGADVLYISRQIRSLFFQKTNNNNHGPIILYGSFINGRSIPGKSDLDFAVLNKKMEAVSERLDLVTNLKDFPFVDAAPHVINAKDIDALGYLNRIVVLVEADYIELRVYRSHLRPDFDRRKAKYDSYDIGLF